MKIYLNKSQMIFPKPDKEFHHYSLDIERSNETVDFLYYGWYDSTPLPIYLGPFPFSLNSDISKAKVIINDNNVFTVIDDYGCQSLQVQLNNETIKNIRNFFCDNGISRLLTSIYKIPQRPKERQVFYIPA